MLKMANSRRAGLSAKLPVAEHGLHRPGRPASSRGGLTTRLSQAGTVAAGLALTLGVSLCGGAAPAGQAGQSPVAIVVLEPRFVSGGGGEAMAAAELACDRLARELEKNAALRVVDRTQLDRILNERRLGSGPAGTILSYDIMVRLEVDAVRPVPRAILKLVDLSDGNLLAEMQFAWSVPLPDGAIRNMAGACQAAARRLAGPSEKALRVRLLEVENPGNSARLDPLASRLREAVAGALARSEGVRPVHHLEALTAKEESLLLTLGLSKLPGGRQFTPQSDATIELRIRELDGVGKTFDQTRVEVAWRIRKGERYSGEWAGAEATVADFDKLVKDAWTRIAGEIGKVTPGAGSDFLNELALRRTQAQAELDAAPKGLDVTREQAIKRLEHVAAAVKIDPTWEEAAYQLVFASLVGFRDPLGYGPPIREAARYLRRFPADRDRCITLANYAFFWAGSRFLKLRYFPSTDPRDIEKLDADARETLDALKQIVDTFAAGPAEDMPGLPSAMHIVYRGMAQMGVPADQRRQWMDRLVSLGSRNVSLATHLPEVHEKKLLDARIRLRMHAAGLLLAEGAGDQARKYLEELVPLLAASDKRKSDFPDFFRQVENLKDPDMLARLSAAMGDTVWPLRINWLNMNPLGMMPATRPRPRANVTALSFTKYQGASPLAACGGRMYCIVPAEKSGDASRAAYVDLDSAGRPAGKITLLANQPARWGAILATAVCDGKLYLGTRGAGLLEYDPAGGKWRAWSPDQGLPGSNVYTLVALDGGVLFCHGGDVAGKPGFLCHVKPATSEITLLRRLDPKVNVGLASESFKPVWRAGDTIYGFIGGGAIYRLPGLGAGEPVRQPWPTPKSNDYYEAYPDGMAIVAGRRLLKCRDALREIDDEGKVLRVWPRPSRARITSGPEELPGHDVLPATDQPDLIDAQEYRCVAQDDSRVFFLDSWILCYEPASETWYGPMETEPFTTCSGSRAVCGPGGIWFQDGRSLIYLDTADFIAAAKKAGLVVTAEDFDKKRLAAIDSAPPLDQAKWRLSLRQFDKARDQAAAVLDKDPTCAEALLIMGLVHEPCCLNEPDKALQYYARLAAMDSDPCVALAGLAHQYRVLFAAGRDAEALKVGRDIERRYPRNSFREALARYNRQMAKQIEGKSK